VLVPLADRPELFRLIVDTVADVAIFAMNLDRTIATWNQSATALLGYSADEVLGKSADVIFTPDDRATGQPEKEIRIAQQDGRAPDERWHVKKDGTRFWATGVLTPLRDANGALIGFVKMMRDRTAHKRNLEALQHAERALQAALARARAAQDEAERANRLKDEFLATLSHELRTPLNAVIGWAHLLQDGIPDEAMERKAIETIHRNALAQNQLVSDILDVSRIVTGKLQLDCRPTDLAGVIEATLETLRPAAEAKEVVLRTKLAAEAAFIVGDSARLQQVVWNLLSNAIKFVPAGGIVEVELRAAPLGVEVCVRDNGAGIDPAFLPHVFERFRQADSSSTRPYRGLGLGLAIVRQLVELHGGTVRATNRDGGGAEFIVTLPRGGNPRLAEGSASSERPISVPPPASLPRHVLEGVRVLVVDDEADSREIARAILTTAGAEVTTAVDAEEAMRRIRGGPPDVLLVDLEMPHEDGYALLRRIRALPADAGGEVVAATLTAYARPEDRARSLSAGFERHVPKPVSPVDLVDVVRELAGRRASTRA
jgi:PAS domain S-box-containing protein